MSAKHTLKAQSLKGQRFPGKTPGERELRVIQKAKSWRIESESPPAISLAAPREDPKWDPPLTPDTVPFEAEQISGPMKVMEGLTAFMGEWCFIPMLTTAFVLGIGL